MGYKLEIKHIWFSIGNPSKIFYQFLYVTWVYSQFQYLHTTHEYACTCTRCISELLSIHFDGQLLTKFVTILGKYLLLNSIQKLINVRWRVVQCIIVCNWSELNACKSKVLTETVRGNCSSHCKLRDKWWHACWSKMNENGNISNILPPIKSLRIVKRLLLHDAYALERWSMNDDCVF